MMKHPEFDQMVALAERLRLELDSSDRKNLVGSHIIPDKSIITGQFPESRRRLGACDYREFCPYLNQHGLWHAGWLIVDLVAELPTVPTIALNLDDRGPLRPHSQDSCGKVIKPENPCYIKLANS
jgi:hypothetical protein